MPGQFLERGVRLIRPDDMHQLTFSNWCWRIMPRVSLPDAPASDLKTGRMGHILQRQFFRRENLVAHQIRHRHFGGRNQKKSRIAAHCE